MNKVKIIIPVYKNELSDSERMSFIQCIQVLKKHPIVLVVPDDLNLTQLTNLYENVEVERFPQKYFKGIEGYNSLMLSSIFYERFIDTEYILIYQLDAFVFRNELDLWCNKGYDYIGAPWIATPRNSLLSRINKFIRKSNSRENIFFKVGNGGFSLRRVSSFVRILQEHNEEINDFFAKTNEDIYKIEDVFWSLKAPELDETFNIPDYKEAVSFAIDRKPKLAIKINNNKLPFGCHGFDKSKVKKFWKPILNRHYIKSE